MNALLIDPSRKAHVFQYLGGQMNLSVNENTEILPTAIHTRLTPVP